MEASKWKSWDTARQAGSKQAATGKLASFLISILMVGREALFAPPDQLRLFGRAEGHVVFSVIEQLIAGEFQVGGDASRSFVETEFRGVGVVRRPRARDGDGLVRQRAVGHAPLLPRAVTAGEAMVRAVHAHHERRRTA